MMKRPVFSLSSCLLGGLLALPAVLPGAEGGEVPAGAGDGTLTPEQQEAWDQLTAEADVAEAMRYAEAENLYQEARAHLRRAHFVEAREAVEGALAVFPAHARAQQLRQDILGILSLRDDRFRMMGRWLTTIGDVAQQEQAVRLANLLNQGQKQMNAGEYNDALRSFDAVNLGIRSFPYRFDWGDLPEQVQSMIFEAQARAREADLLAQRRAREAAARAARLQSEMRESALRAQVNEILRRAHRSYARKDYRRAAIDAWNAYELDRRREDARRLYLEARRMSHVQFDEELEREQPELMARVNEEIHMALVPQTDLLVYPSNWEEIDLRKPQEIGESTEEPWQREIRDRLEQEVNFTWEDTSLEDAVEFLRRATGVNFIIDTRVLAEAPPPPITLQGTMKLRTVLNWITQITDLRMSIRNQAVFLSTEDSEGDVLLQLYNVTDLLSPVQDFPGPELAFSAGGGGFDIFNGADAGGGEAGLDIDQIVGFIETSVAPDSWGAPGVAIDIRQGGTLFISQAPEVHRLIRALLAELRQQQSLQVNVQIRVLDVKKAFIEEIGFDWHDLTSARGLLGSTTEEGFSRVASDALGYGRVLNVLPSNAMTTSFDTSDAGLRVEGSYNLTGQLNGPQVNMIMTAMEQEADGTVLFSPEITVFNSQRGNAQFIRQYSYISDYSIETGGGTGNGTYDPSIQVVNVGDIIDVRPLVSADRKYVTLEVRPSSVALDGVFTEEINVVTTIANALAILQYPIELPNLEVRTLRTTVMLPDKGSVMLGGFRSGLRQRSHSGIPFLSHIPFLGRLFSKNGIYDENRHLFFLVTTTILDIAETEGLQ